MDANAQNPNTFVFNGEWAAVLKQFSAEVRLEVYDAIVDYATTGTVGELQPLAKMAFLLIKREIDFNRAKYEATVAKRREAGRRSAEARARRAAAKSQPQPQKPQKPQQPQPQQPQEPEFEPQPQQPQEPEFEPQPQPQAPAAPAVQIEGANEVVADQAFVDRFFDDAETIDAFCCNNSIRPDQLRGIVNEVIYDWRLAGTTHATEADARKHLINTARIKLRALNAPVTYQAYMEMKNRRRAAESAAITGADYTGEF